VCERYKDASVDKVKEAQKAANELKLELNKGVKNLIGNRDNLDEINDKASLMKGTLTSII
jgi:sugar-specific transcriptional regulator TrmB